jgi:type VI secretion system protein ImpH
MAAENRTSSVFLIDTVRDEPYDFDFFRLVQLLERFKSDRVAIGHNGPYSEETIHFEEDISLAFPPGDVLEVRGLEDGAEKSAVSESSAALARQTFFGFLGHGVLPEHYTLDVYDDLRVPSNDRRSSRKDFLEIFQHRLLSLFFRAWQKYDYVSAYEAAQRQRHSNPEAEPFDEISEKAFCMVGLGSASGRDDSGVPAKFLLYFSGAFSSQSRNAIMLEKMLRSHFGLETNVIPFVGKWLYLEEGDRSRLGRLRGTRQRLGESLIVGRKIWDMQCLIRIRIGPLSFDEFRRFLPGEKAFAALGQIVRLYIGADNDYQLQLVLRAAETPGFRLSRGGPTRIGYCSWIGRQPRSHDAEEAIFRSPS